MFTRIRARLDNQLAAISQQQPTSPAFDADRTQVAVSAEALASAQSTLTGRQSAAATAQNALVSAQSTVTAAAGALTGAQKALADLAANEPIEEGPRGKPNPAHARWEAQMKLRRDAVAGAQRALDQANGGLAAATAASAQAVDAMHQAEGAVAAAQQSLDAANSQLNVDLAMAQAAQQQQIATLRAQLAQLEAEEDRIEAQPPDPDDLAVAADAQTAAVEQARRDRQQHWAHRLATRQARAAMLDDHDAMIDKLAAIRDAAEQLNTAHAFPGLAELVADLNQVLTDNADQRTQPADQRSSDLAAVAAALTHARQVLGASVAAANGEVDTATRQLVEANQLVEAAKNEWT